MKEKKTADNRPLKINLDVRTESIFDMRTQAESEAETMPEIKPEIQTATPGTNTIELTPFVEVPENRHEKTAKTLLVSGLVFEFDGAIQLYRTADNALIYDPRTDTITQVRPAGAAELQDVGPLEAFITEQQVQTEINLARIINEQSKVKFWNRIRIAMSLAAFLLVVMIIIAIIAIFRALDFAALGLAITAGLAPVLKVLAMVIMAIIAALLFLTFIKSLAAGRAATEPTYDAAYMPRTPGSPAGQGHVTNVTNINVGNAGHGGVNDAQSLINTRNF